MANTDKLIDEYRQEKEEEKKGVVACGVCGKTLPKAAGDAISRRTAEGGARDSHILCSNLEPL